MRRMLWLLSAAILAACQSPPEKVIVPTAVVPVVQAEVDNRILFTNSDPLFTASKSLVHWWPADGHTLDLGGTKGMSHAKLSGATFVPGPTGRAFYFDGVSAYVDCGPSKESFPQGNAFTIIYNGKAEAHTGWHYIMACFKDKGMTHAYNYLDMDGMEFAVGVHGHDATKDKLWTYGEIHTSLEKFHQVALSYDGKELSIFIDGKLSVAKEWKIYEPPTDAHFTLGRYVDGPTGSTPFKGAIGNVMVFSQSLSDEEIAAVYAARGAEMKYSQHQVARLADALQSDDPAAAWYAVMRAAPAGDRATTQLAAQMLPATSRSVREMIADLGAEDFATRERATAELETLGHFVDGQLIAALEETKNAEARGRLAALLNSNFISPLRLRHARVRAALVAIGTPAAARVAAGLWEPPALTSTQTQSPNLFEDTNSPRNLRNLGGKN